MLLFVFILFECINVSKVCFFLFILVKFRFGFIMLILYTYRLVRVSGQHYDNCDINRLVWHYDILLVLSFFIHLHLWISLKWSCSWQFLSLVFFWYTLCIFTLTRLMMMTVTNLYLWLTRWFSFDIRILWLDKYTQYTHKQNVFYVLFLLIL